MKRVRSSFAVVLGLGAVGAAATAPASPREPLRVGGVVAQAGQQASGYLLVPDGVDPGTKIPVSLFHGSNPGPVLALIAGTHGSEYTSIVALQRVRARLDPFGLDHIVIDRERPSDPERTLYTSNTAVRRGKPAITVESGGMGLTDEPSVHAQEAGVLSVMAELGMLEAPSLRVEKPLFIDRAQVVTSPATGVWHPLVEKMQSVATGTLLGRLSDPFGNVTHELRAPFAGEVLYVVATPPVSEGEPLAFVGHVVEAAPRP